MHWVEVEGYPLPKLFGGHIAVEFCNTRAAWHAPLTASAEWIKTYDRFAVWAGHAGVLDAETVTDLRRQAAHSPETAETVLTEVAQLREALYPVLLRTGSPDEFAEVARFAERATAASRLRPTEAGGAVWRLDPGQGLALPLLEVANAAADLLCSAKVSQVRRCPGNDCGWLFLDPRGRRRWCSMTVCGNKSKARTFARRHAL
jgi:predicted RNA-binding Zn ribbon-like protein